MNDILIISNYYPPEKGAAANRIEQLAKKLHEKNYSVTVVCPLGNYPEGKLFPEYKGKFSLTENKDSITVKRLWIYPSISKNLFIRLLSVLSFTLSLFFYLSFKKTPNKVIVQSPPLLLSFISVFILSLKKKKIILNVSDLWPLAAVELKALKKGSFSHKFSLFLEQYIYKKATLILGQSDEILTHIKTLFPNKNCYLYRNFPDHKIENLNLISLENQPIRIFYAGLLGIAQGIYELCEKIELDGLNIELHLFGNGAEKKQIEELILTEKGKNIFFHGMLNRNDLHEKLKSFDIAVVPLKTRIYGSVPSKIFEYGSLGFPILYFGGGEGENIVEENNLGWVASVEDYNDLNNKLKLISNLDKYNLNLMKKRIFEETKEVFNLDNQMNYLIDKNVF
ncbi:glycosyltransferase family 4 protein [Flavobacterium macrobrachii]|jgi:glycosyltransferase involved in cell wall biosynthesis|uniref:Glycosyltransferase family 4 protein n=1 Tax=Flavobacterium macrobrachii TaxID=591204 RepID=A0ABS2D383_9FLAO|nr:glycosyltransferase family 4 protein [Flavobacterium macrobrachii]MBM6500845.1 glycosyltransferase family 4 protein [Flavobacterium macrobrachii]PZO28126.1 MAG: glycosyltransferase WbuB [Flavobacteriaceae bacterium]